MSTILAKTKNNITLQQHTLGLLAFSDILAEKCAVDKEILRQICALHDIGKVSPAFQVASLRNFDYTPKSLLPNVPHSLLSLLFINPQKIEKEYRRSVFSSISFHHWRGNFTEIISGIDHDLRVFAHRLIENKNLKKRLVDNLKECFGSDQKLNVYADLIGFNKDLAERISEGDDLATILTPPYLSYFLPQRINDSLELKKENIIFAGLLLRLDHFVSYMQEKEPDEGATIELDLPEEISVLTTIKQLIVNKNGLWQEDLAKDNKEKSLIVVAPTGSGKTELAALWGAGFKIFFTLPLRAAVNSNFKRMQKYFGNNSTSLLHSDADVFLYKEAGGSETSENKKILEMARQLSFPVQISTGDQIFPSALKYPGYEKIYATLSYSRLIIDEVQAYDPKSAAIIIKLIEDITKLDGKFMLMTATLPDLIKDEIIKRSDIKADQIIDRYEGLEHFAKHKVSIQKAHITDSITIDDIINTAKMGKRVLVIANTVKKAQAVYGLIKEKSEGIDFCKLLHSRFTQFDRACLEDEVIENEYKNPKPADEKIPKILVATQIVEASLDIDADVLFTELAPIDSLVQRMGRILRRVRFDEEPHFQLQETDEANIKILFEINKNEKNNNKGLESGMGRVYENDLLAITVLVLTGDYEQFVDNKKGSGDKKNLVSFKPDEIVGFYGDIKDKLLTEPEKNSLVNEVYSKLSEDSGYKEQFYDTLSILDAGFVSDRKKDANDLFRKILSAQVIVAEKAGEFEKSIEAFCQNDISWTSFKSEVIAKYVVNINLFSFDRSGASSAKVMIPETVEMKKRSKIASWLDGIVMVKDWKYNSETGITIKEDWLYDF